MASHLLDGLLRHRGPHDHNGLPVAHVEMRRDVLLELLNEAMHRRRMALGPRHMRRRAALFGPYGDTIGAEDVRGPVLA